MQEFQDLLRKFCKALRCERNASVQVIKDDINCLQEVFVSPIFLNVYVIRTTYASIYLKSRLDIPVSTSKREIRR